MDASPAPSAGSGAEALGPFQFIVLVLSLVVLGALGVDTLVSLPPEISRILHFADTAVCAVFLLDFILRFRSAPSKTAFLKWGWIDLLASIPAIAVTGTDTLRWGRLVRVLRLLRLLRSLRSIHRLFSMLFQKKAEGGIATVVLTMFLLISFSSVSVLVFERTPDANIRSAGDAVWWSVTTITTVGYGDKYPVTTEGRILAMMLMLAGVGLFGTLSGIVATFFLGRREAQTGAEVDQTLVEVRALREELRALHREREKP